MIRTTQSVPTVAMVASAVAGRASTFPTMHLLRSAKFLRASVRAREVAAVVLPPCAPAINLPGDAPARSQHRRVFSHKGKMA